MYKSISWSPQSPLSSDTLQQMVENDKENYLTALSSAGPVLGMAVMRNKYESMPGNNPTKISPLCIDVFRAPYTGWYKAHFSCSSARQDTTGVTIAGGTSTTIYLDGFFFVITARRTSRVNVQSQYDPVTGESLFEAGQFPNSAAIGDIIARASFGMSGMSVPVAATGYKWLNRGDMVAWDLYTYVANNNYDLLSSPYRNWGRIILNSRQKSDTNMAYGSPRTYNYPAGGTGAVVPSTAVDNPAAPTSNNYKTVSNLISPNDVGNRYSFLMVQFVGQGGMPGVFVNNNLEKTLYEENNITNANVAYEV